MKPFNWILRGLVVLGTALLFVPGINLPLPGSKPRVIVLIDASRSMSDKAKEQMLDALSKTIELFKTKFSLQVYEFADTLAKRTSFLNVKFDGSKTDIGRALEKLDTRDVDAVLLVSDGRHNGYVDPNLRRLPAPLWTFAVGQGNLPDISIEEASVDDDTADQKNKNLRIQLRSNLKESIKTDLGIYSQDKLLRMLEVTLVPERLTEITVPVSVTDTITTWKILLDSLANEDRTDNNSLKVRVVSGQGKTRLLFVAGLITDDTKEILHALREMPRFSLATRIELAPGKVLEDAKINPGIILIGPAGSNLSASTIDLLKNHLNRGTPVLFMNAAQNLPAALYPFLPLKEGGEEGGGAARTSRDISTPLSDVLFLEWEPQAVTADKRNYVAVSNAEVIYSKKSAGFISAMKTPVHSMALEFRDLGFQIRRDRKGFESFLEASLMYTMDPDAFPFNIQVEDFKEGYAEITLHSEVPIQAGELAAWLAPDSHSLDIAPASSMSFKLEGAAPKGVYRLNVIWRGKSYSPKGRIEVSEPSEESVSRGANYELLKQLARNNHGQFITTEQGVRNFASSLPKRRNVRFKPIENPLFVILIGSLLLVEIWQRRKNGLP